MLVDCSRTQDRRGNGGRRQHLRERLLPDRGGGGRRDVRLPGRAGDARPHEPGRFAAGQSGESGAIAGRQRAAGRAFRQRPYRRRRHAPGADRFGRLVHLLVLGAAGLGPADGLQRLDRRRWRKPDHRRQRARPFQRGPDPLHAGRDDARHAGRRRQGESGDRYPGEVRAAAGGIAGWNAGSDDAVEIRDLELELPAPAPCSQRCNLLPTTGLRQADAFLPAAPFSAGRDRARAPTWARTS